MTTQEFSNEFDVLYNNIMSNQAPGLDEYEKSVFLTKAQAEILKNYFNPKGNKYQEGFDDNQKRQIDFSNLMKSYSVNSSITGTSVNINTGKIGTTDVTVVGVIIKSTGHSIDFNNLTPGSYTISNVTTYTFEITISATVYTITVNSNISGLTSNFAITATPININKIDSRSQLYVMPNDILFVLNESILTTGNKILTIIPLKYDEYSRLMSKPFKRPLKNQAWRLINSINADKTVEIITNMGDMVNLYNLRYVKRPQPIVLANLTDIYQNITIEGKSVVTECELDEILHPEILQRAVELAKAAYTGDIKSSTELGQRSE